LLVKGHAREAVPWKTLQVRQRALVHKSMQQCDQTLDRVQPLHSSSMGECSL
jgi:hypothetical protein